MILAFIGAELAGGGAGSAPLPERIVLNPIYGRGLKVISKLAEKVVSQQIVDRIYLTSNSILSPTRFSYRPAHSSESAMLNLVSKTNNNTDNGLVTSLAPLDLSKTFDCVERQALLSALGCCISTH